MGHKVNSKQLGTFKTCRNMEMGKKGKEDNPTAYRALQIGSSLCKIMVVVIIEQIKKWYESQLIDQQQGFRTGRGTIDDIYKLKRVYIYNRFNEKTSIPPLRRFKCSV